MQTKGHTKGSIPIFLAVVVLAFLGVWFILQPLLNVQLSFLVALLVTLGIVFLSKGIGFGGKMIPFSKGASLGLAAVTLIVALFMAGTFASFGALGQPATIGAIPATQVQATAGGATLSSCEASVSSDIRGTSATVTVNAWDLEADNPYGSAVDVADTFVFKSNSIAASDSTNYLTTLTDTSAGSVTGVKVGEVITIVGGSSGYYLEPAEGVCIDGQQKSVNLNAHVVNAEGGYTVVVYDSTGSTALSAGDESIDYKRSLGANEEQLFFQRPKVDDANNGYWLCGIGYANGLNVSRVTPDSSKFSPAITPLHMKDVAIEINGTDVTSSTMTRTYSIYKLNTPVLLSEFDEAKWQFTIEAGANDPVGAAGGDTGSAIVWGITKDCAWTRGTDGRMYYDLYNHTSTQPDSGLQETETSPNGLDVGFAIEIE